MTTIEKKHVPVGPFQQTKRRTSFRAGSSGCDNVGDERANWSGHSRLSTAPSAFPIVPGFVALRVRTKLVNMSSSNDGMSDASKPYNRLLLTDFERQPAPNDASSADVVRLYVETCKNMQVMVEQGARGPFWEISGLCSRTSR
eukprot:7137916-Pyramimonas_sp.AAC.1